MAWRMTVAILREGDGVERIERFHDGDEIAIAKLCVDETASALRARAHVASPACT